MNNFIASISAFFNSSPMFVSLWDYLWIMFSLSALMAFAGLDFLSAICRIRGSILGKITYNKLGRQLAMLAMILGWILLCSSRIWLYFCHPSPAVNTVEYYIVEISWILLGVAVVLCSVYFLLWKILKNMPVLLTTLGMVSAVQCCLSSFAILACTRIISNTNSAELPGMSISDLFSTALDSSLWSALAYTVPLIFAMPGAWAAVWLPTRKKKDNFGRDYYNSSIVFCAKWARNAWLCLWVMLAAFAASHIWQNLKLDKISEQAIIIECLQLVLWLAPVLFWNIVSHSAVALRHKGGIFLAFIIASCFMLTYFNTLTKI